MPLPPEQPKIYHIVHVDRLASVLADGNLYSDRVMINRDSAGTTIGMGSIKARRLQLPVVCHPGDCVGDYVPFYFCPRSVMLFLIHRANHPELAYRGGQGPIVHLEANLREAVEWAEANQRRWAFTLSNAGAAYAPFRDRLDQLDQVNWPAVAAHDFRAAEIKEGKQAEFLMHREFPWHLFRRIGAHSGAIAQLASNAMHGMPHRPQVEIRSDWYY
jgi:hypothetical protein